VTQSGAATLALLFLFAKKNVCEIMAVARKSKKGKKRKNLVGNKHSCYIYGVLRAQENTKRVSLAVCDLAYLTRTAAKNMLGHRTKDGKIIECW
jgi:uncharacterized protein (DUF169 family)